MPKKAAFTYDEFQDKQKRDGRDPPKRRPKIDWPDDPEKQREMVTSLGLEALMKQVGIAGLCFDEIDQRDLSKEDLRAVASAARLGAQGAKDAQATLAELVPTRIIAEFNFALATGETDCPCCKRPWPEDLPRDMSGFDKPPAEA